MITIFGAVVFVLIFAVWFAVKDLNLKEENRLVEHYKRNRKKGPFLVLLVFASAFFLNLSSKESEASPPHIAITEWLSLGDSGPAVSIVQQALVDGGWPTWVDGYFGPHTDRMVRGLQSANGLVVDGIVGPQTLAVLSISSSAKAEEPATRTSIPSAPISSDARCGEWWGLASNAGWPTELLPRLDYIMWRESRCNPAVLANDHNDYSFGLLQINVKPGIGTQDFVGPLVDWDWSRLYDPEINLRVGWEFYKLWSSRSYSGYCGWWGWSTKGSGWC